MYHDQEIDIIYIDTAEKGLADYPDVQQIIGRGYGFPVISFNGLPRLAGAINYEDVKSLVDEYLKGEPQS
ncbi:MAG: hypothetical protein ACM3UZ_03240 [Acidobacteriota bacterium]